MAKSVDATVRVRGDVREREGFRRRANERLAAGFPEASYRELHSGDELDWRLKCAGGMPFPPFVEASVEYPGVECVLEWRERTGAGAAWRATLKAGQLALEAPACAPPSGPGVLTIAVRAAGDGELDHALAMQPLGDGQWLGYVASATRHAFFSFDPQGRSLKLSDGLDPEWTWLVIGNAQSARRAAIDPPEAVADDTLERLHDLADRFAAEWLWFDAAPEPETVVERHRYAQYGIPVRPANLRSAKLKRVLVADASGYSLTPAADDARSVSTLVAAMWRVAETG